jgi:hypothetical protein
VKKSKIPIKWDAKGKAIKLRRGPGGENDIRRMCVCARGRMYRSQPNRLELCELMNGVHYRCTLSVPVGTGTTTGPDVNRYGTGVCVCMYPTHQLTQLQAIGL